MALIVLEGVDGAGKSTQLTRLRTLFEQRGARVEYLHFPRFTTPVYGRLIARYLRGELGTLDGVNPYLVALLFAGDRAEAAPMLRRWLAEGRTVLLDRYVYSNVGFQCAKFDSEAEREALARWIVELEYGHHALPRPDLQLFLDVPEAFTRRRLGTERTGADRTYLAGQADIHESSLALQRRVRQTYLGLAANDATLHLVSCADRTGGMAPAEEVFERLVREVEPFIPARS